MKKALTLLMAIFMLATVMPNLAAASSGGPYMVAVATIHEGEIWEIQKKYYEEEVGPALNMEFMFSEKLNDANGLIDFMGQAYAAGCVGVINYVTSSDAVAQGSRKAQEWGMYFVTQNSAHNAEVADVPNNLGHCGASADGMGAAYKKLFTELLADGENHSLFLFSGAAVGGAIGQGAASHYHSAYGMLEAMQEAYGLTYEKTIDEIINEQNPSAVATGNENINIYIYPGRDPSAALTTVQTQLQSGKFDIFAAVFSYSSFTNVIADVEQSLNKDIKVIGTASIEAQTATGFTTFDTFGNTVLNSAVVNPLNIQNGMDAIILYNGLTGHGEAMKKDGQSILYKVEPWVCADAPTYENISLLDTSSETYVLTGDDLKALCVENDAGVNYETIEARLTGLADVQSIIGARLK